MTKTRVPELSVIVTIVEGGKALHRCLEALSNQMDPPGMEIIVPYDESIAEVAQLATTFPAVSFLKLGRLAVDGPPDNPLTLHELYDQRRSGGLREAKAGLVAMLEDRGRPQPAWARAMLDLHASSSCPAVGGAVENGAHDSIRWALFFCDFGRFQPPVEQDNPEYITDINICYKRSALESVRDLWEQRYQEPRVNWALRRSGRLYLSQRPVVVHERVQISLWSAVTERVQFGRIFGQIRGREAPFLKCLLWAASTPIVPWVVFVRHFRRQLGKRRHVREFVLAMPAILLFLHAWIAGEFLGYCDSAVRYFNRKA